MQPVGVDPEGNLLYDDAIEPIVIRTTDRTNFKECRRAWHYQSPLGHERSPIRMNKNLAFGIAMHKGFEQFYSPDNFAMDMPIRLNAAIVSFKDTNLKQLKVEHEASLYGVSDERKEEYLERETLGTGMLRNYAHYVESTNADEGWTPLAVEWKFQVPIVHPTTGEPLVVRGRPVVYQVRLDLVAEDSEGGIWAWDHKTAASLEEDTSWLDLDTQLSSYLWACTRVLGRPVEGLVYNEVVKSVPKPPKVLKKGGLSQDKRQNTTYELYVKSIENFGLDPAPYAGMLDYLRANPKELVRRTPIPRSTKELAIQGQYIYEEALDMTRENLSIYPNPSKMRCKGCDFRPPCTVANEGGDDLYLLNNPAMYTEREKG